MGLMSSKNIENKGIIPLHKIICQPFYLFSFIFFIGFIFLGDQRVTWVAYDLLVILELSSFLVKKKRFIYIVKFRFWLPPLIVFLLILFGMCLLINGCEIVGLLSFYYMTRNLILIYSFLDRIQTESKIMNDFILQLFYILIFWLVINTPYMIIQHNQNIFHDDVTGLMGKGTTQNMAFVWLFMLTTSLFLKKNIILIILMHLTMLYLSSISDNKFYIYISFFPYLIYYATTRNFNFTCLLIKVIVFTICFLIILSSYLLLNSGTNRSNKTKLMLPIETFTTFIEKKIYSPRAESVRFHSQERSELVLTLFRRFPNCWNFGIGAGAISNIFFFRGKDVGKYTHINMNEFLTITYEMGFLFFIIISSIYIMLISSFFKGNSKIIIFFVTLFFFACSYYHRILHDPRDFFSIMLLVSTISVVMPSHPPANDDDQL